jgi:sugar/nucleoside kinase (ribokinase family)
MPDYDLICIAGTSVDLMLRASRLPAPDEKMVVDFAGRMAGGLVANTACAASRLGMKTAWAGQMGTDAGAQVLEDGFKAAGVDLHLVEILPGAANNLCVILLTPGGERTILIANSLPEPPPLSDAMLKALEACRVGYALARPPAWFDAFAGAVHAGGGLVAVDLEGTSLVSGEELTHAMRQTDILFAGERGLRAFEIEDEDQAVAHLLGLGLSEVIVTRGARGASLFTADGAWHVLAYRVTVVDSTGAGDCFHAAYLAARQEGMRWEARLRFASAAAAIKVGHLGARGGLPTFEQVETFLDDHEP